MMMIDAGSCDSGYCRDAGYYDDSGGNCCSVVNCCDAGCYFDVFIVCFCLSLDLKTFETLVNLRRLRWCRTKVLCILIAVLLLKMRVSKTRSFCASQAFFGSTYRVVTIRILLSFKRTQSLRCIELHNLHAFKNKV
jgi:hypothetical protein